VISTMAEVAARSEGAKPMKGSCIRVRWVGAMGNNRMVEISFPNAK